MVGIANSAQAPPAEDGLLPANPFTGLSFHFGMLLGVDDFETEQGYHLGKDRLHNAWLHREGVVWGFGVETSLDRGEIRIEPGLALDAAGRELHLESPACVNVGAWFDAHRNDPGFSPESVEGGGVHFDAHVVASFRACLARQVPALAEACVDAAASTAYSRVYESVKLLLVPGKAPVPDPLTEPYRRLRLFFGLAEPAPSGDARSADDQRVLEERSRIGLLDPSAQPAELLRVFRELAALDGLDLGPGDADEDGDTSLLFPDGEDVQVVLADVLGITLVPGPSGWLLTGGAADASIRRTHVATATAQELVLGMLLAQAAAPGPAGVVDAGGPRVASVEFVDAKTIVLHLTKPLVVASVNEEAFRVSGFRENGWHHIKITDRDYQQGATTLTLKLKEDPGDLVRLTVRGTGLTPLLGEDLTPLAGGLDSPRGSRDDGSDFVLMHPQGS
jgi:hypothetical protein